jgi:hypothetical protein
MHTQYAYYELVEYIIYELLSRIIYIMHTTFFRTYVSRL